MAKDATYENLLEEVRAENSRQVRLEYDDSDLRVTIRQAGGLNTMRVADALARATEPYALALAAEKISDAQVQLIIARVAAETLVVNIEGSEAPDVLTEEAVTRWLIANPLVLDDVAAIAQDVASFEKAS